MISQEVVRSLGLGDKRLHFMVTLASRFSKLYIGSRLALMKAFVLTSDEVALTNFVSVHLLRSLVCQT
jgi:hypothetical protein